MKLIVLDTETSDLDPTKGAEVIQIAWIELSETEGVWKPIFSTDFNIAFNGIISPHAQAVHHISANKLTIEKGAVPREKAIEFLLQHIETDSILVAHYADFDKKFFPQITRPWICTYRASKHIWPGAPSHSNQVLRYWLDLDIFKIAAAVATRRPHEALYDAATTASILLKMLEKHTVEQLLIFSKIPARLQKINFGKHKGTEFNQIPKDYLQWLRQKQDIDDDLRFTIDDILNK